MTPLYDTVGISLCLCGIRIPILLCCRMGTLKPNILFFSVYLTGGTSFRRLHGLFILAGGSGSGSPDENVGTKYSALLPYADSRLTSLGCRVGTGISALRSAALKMISMAMAQISSSGWAMVVRAGMKSSAMGTSS